MTLIESARSCSVKLLTGEGGGSVGVLGYPSRWGRSAARAHRVLLGTNYSDKEVHAALEEVGHVHASPMCGAKACAGTCYPYSG
jgi:hypothetical protein